MAEVTINLLEDDSVPSIDGTFEQPTLSIGYEITLIVDNNYLEMLNDEIEQYLKRRKERGNG